MAILHNKHTCDTAVAATTIVGSGSFRVWTASNLTDAGLRVILVKRTSCTLPFTSHHNQHPNIEILTNARVIDVEGQASDLVVSPHQEPRAGDIELCLDRGRTSTRRTKKDFTRYSSLGITKSL